MDKLRDLFVEADISGDGNLSLTELEDLLESPMVKAYVSVLELDVHEVQSLFYLLDDGDGFVTYDEFLNGILRLKGSARSQDVIMMMHDCRHILKECEGISEVVRSIAEPDGKPKSQAT